MAETGYGCEFGDCTTAPNHLVTTISPAATVSLCDEHYPAGLIPLLASELGVDPGRFYQHVERFIAKESKLAEEAVADAQAAEAVKGSSDPDDSPEQDPAPAADDQGDIFSQTVQNWPGEGFRP